MRSGTICGTELVTEMLIHFGMSDDRYRNVREDREGAVLRSCIRKEGLKSKLYCRQYDIFFGGNDMEPEEDDVETSHQVDGGSSDLGF